VEMHAGQLSVTVETVRELVAEQFPQWRELSVEAVRSEGTDNALFRLGEELVARFPLLAAEIEATRQGLEAEARAARVLLGRTAFPTPEPIAFGKPGPGYPLPWSVQTWLPGTPATIEDPCDSHAFGRDLAEFIGGVRAIETGGRAFSGDGRGGLLRDHDEWMATCFERSEGLLDVAPLRRLWTQLRELPRGEDPDLMNHGDLISGNVLVLDGRLGGVIDVGGLGPADPALDLVAAWHLLEAGPRETLRAVLGCADLEWARGGAWAFQQAIGVVWYYAESNPPMSRMGRRTLRRLLAASSTSQGFPARA
jgi:aminoglycoside phosphotransferase (APT) family kinase protein